MKVSLNDGNMKLVLRLDVHEGALLLVLNHGIVIWWKVNDVNSEKKKKSYLINKSEWDYEDVSSELQILFENRFEKDSIDLVMIVWSMFCMYSRLM